MLRYLDKSEEDTERLTNRKKLKLIESILNEDTNAMPAQDAAAAVQENATAQAPAPAVGIR